MISGGACKFSTTTMRKQTLIFCLALLRTNTCKPRTKSVLMLKQAVQVMKMLGIPKMVILIKMKKVK
jgi:hypothetical protein